MSNSSPTPEEIEAARKIVTKADQAEAAAKRAATRDLLAPFVEAGLGSTDEDSPIKAVIKALRDNAMALLPVDQNLPNSFFVTAQALENVDDKIRSLAAMNSEPAS